MVFWGKTWLLSFLKSRSKFLLNFVGVSNTNWWAVQSCQTSNALLHELTTRPFIANLVKCFFQTICFWNVKQWTLQIITKKSLYWINFFPVIQNQSKCPRQLLLVSSFVHGRFLDKQRSRATKVEEVRCGDDFYDDEVASVSFLYNLEC